MAFSRHHGVCYQTFVAWLRKRRHSGKALPPGVLAFAEVMLQDPPPASGAALRIVLPCNTTLEGKRSTDGGRKVLVSGASVEYTGMYAFDDILRLKPGGFPER